MQLSSIVIKQTAQQHGFSLCGIAKSFPLRLEKERFEKALAQNFHAQKAYLERDIEKRFSPEFLLKDCKSVIVCGFNYNAEEQKSGRAEERKSGNAEECRGGCSKSQKTLTARCAKGLRKERKVLNLRDIFFATFAKNRCVFAVKKLFEQPPCTF
jgi:epoxyqueuosine reductase QueG